MYHNYSVRQPSTYRYNKIITYITRKLISFNKKIELLNSALSKFY